MFYFHNQLCDPFITKRTYSMPWQIRYHGQRTSEVSSLVMPNSQLCHILTWHQTSPFNCPGNPPSACSCTSSRLWLSCLVYFCTLDTVWYVKNFSLDIFELNDQKTVCNLRKISLLQKSACPSTCHQVIPCGSHSKAIKGFLM